MTAAVVIAVLSPLFGHFEAKSPVWRRMARWLVYQGILGGPHPTHRDRLATLAGDHWMTSSPWQRVCWCSPADEQAPRWG
jgi:hypothetical protein